ncbi:MAG: DUF2807 domain-containing protein [Bacteroidales bacterium]|nr:DUF2807 domain-containing protein [Bacteroidales bacterium]
MKKFLLMLSVLGAFLLTSSSATGQTKETRNVRNFTKVSYGISGELILRMGPEYSLTIEGDRDDIEDIITTVSGDRLTIRQDNWRIGFRNQIDRVTVYLTMPEVEGIGVSGSGRLSVMDPIEADDLDLRVSGSGRLSTSALNADDLHCGISGSGDIVLGKGSIDEAAISISGSGSFSGEEADIDRLEVSISGSGSARCGEVDELEAHVSGSGNVIYSGSPKVNARISGSGHVRSR